ncbi:hypothetical protein BDY21DRAFT_275417, partial [Lineolata rhizophorae]
WLDSLSVPLRAYARANDRRPHATQVASAVVIYFAGDLGAHERAADEADEAGEGEGGARWWYSPRRALRAAAVGAVAAVPAYRWFLWLGGGALDVFPAGRAAGRAANLAAKVLVNQAVFTPVFNCYFFGMQGALAGDGPAEVLDRLRRTVPASWANSWKVWPAVTAVSFAFVPPQLRSVFAGVIAVGWQTYLSLLNQRAALAEK